ncbi:MULTISPECIES: nitrile hydratase accessory protein [Rhodococcus]|uniref:nitrile hydratase accessory protein n=1 Tax=Rhodococcus TaxID=1827 RepID=UPI00228415E8|nr:MULTISPECIES: nitrile hydratase accessory protein [Rhodococcus]MCZ1074818.1 nitrile hydratase accessory protein [Rhodococcus sp. A5(2022)]WAL49422.1 nitrile hydratase accessory protein [Rhodococcus pyridinivorans]
MPRLNEQPHPDLEDNLGDLVQNLPFNERIPRRSGEVAFDQAWEIRAFSIATALHGQGRFEWDEFQSRLIESIKQWEAEHATTEQWSYYERWMLALEELLHDKGFVAGEELTHRTEQVLATPAGAHHQHAVRDPIAVHAIGTPTTDSDG